MGQRFAKARRRVRIRSNLLERLVKRYVDESRRLSTRNVNLNIGRHDARRCRRPRRRRLRIHIVSIPLLVLALWLSAVLPRPSPSSAPADDDAPVHLPGSSLSHVLPFFHRRFDFLNQGFQLAGQAIYQFTLLRVRTCADRD